MHRISHSGLPEWNQQLIVPFNTCMKLIPHFTLPGSYLSSLRGDVLLSGLCKCHLRHPAKKARQGDYQPPEECISFASKRLVKQLRRTISSRQRFQKHKKMSQCWQNVVWAPTGWDAIRRNLVHDQPFVHWVNRIPELSPCPKCIPDVSWLLDAEQFLRHAVGCQISHESRVLKRCAKMRDLIDCQDGHKVSTFAQVRSCNSASFRTVDQLVTEQAIAVATCDPKCYQLFVENTHQYPFQDRIFVNELKGHVQDFDSHSLRSDLMKHFQLRRKKWNLCKDNAILISKQFFSTSPSIGCNFGKPTVLLIIFDSLNLMPHWLRYHLLLPCKNAQI